MKSEHKRVYIAPYGAVFPTDSVLKEVAVTDFRDVVHATSDEHEKIVCMVSGNLEMLRLVIKYCEYFRIQITALEGIPGGNYDLMWDQTVYPLDRESFQVINEAHTHEPISAPSEAAQVRKHLNSFEAAHRPKEASSRAPDPADWDSGDNE